MAFFHNWIFLQQQNFTFFRHKITFLEIFRILFEKKKHFYCFLDLDFFGFNEAQQIIGFKLKILLWANHRPNLRILIPIQKIISQKNLKKKIEKLLFVCKGFLLCL